MKKRLFSALFTAVLTVAVAISFASPLFAALSDSDLLGTGDKITKIVLTKSSYTVYTGNDPIDLSEGVVALVNNNLLGDPTTLNYELVDPGFHFALDGYMLSSYDRGSGKVVVTNSKGTAKATISISAVESKAATGLRLDKSTVSYPVGSSSCGVDMIATPTPTGSKFSNTQLDAIKTAIDGALAGVALGITASYNEDVSKIDISLVGDATALTSRTRVSVTGVTNINDFSFTLNPVRYRELTSVNGKGTLNIKVGETYDLMDWVKSNSTPKAVGGVSFSLDTYGSNSSTGYAALVGPLDTSIIGVATGKVKVTARTDSGYDFSFNVVVSAYDGSSSSNEEDAETPEDENIGSETRLNSSSKTFAVGTSFNLGVVNAPANAKISYSSANSSIAAVNSSGTVTAKAKGATYISVKVNDLELICNLNVTGSNSGSTDVPQTGLAFLTPLF